MSHVHTEFVSLAYRPGALVRTKQPSPTGVHRDEIKKVFTRDGKGWASGRGWEFPVDDLVVIRRALA